MATGPARPEVAVADAEADLDVAMRPVQTRRSRLLIGRARPNSVEREERLGNATALAVLSSDALSSVAYATEEMMKVLVPVVGLAAFSLGVPIGGAIVLLLILLVLSYRQTIKAYPSAGGAYVVTRDNFGLLPAQVAGVSLLIDYIMTVAVSVSAGVAALHRRRLPPAPPSPARAPTGLHRGDPLVGHGLVTRRDPPGRRRPPAHPPVCRGCVASFIFSQAGMTRRHLRLREDGWKKGLVVNAIGGGGSAMALIAILVAKFSHGAWAIIVLVPLGVTLFVSIHAHYQKVDRLEADPGTAASWTPTALDVVVVAGAEELGDAGTRWAQRTAPDRPIRSVRRRQAGAMARRKNGTHSTLTLFVIARRPVAPGREDRGVRSWDRLARRLARTPRAAVAIVTVGDLPPVRGDAHAAVVVVEAADARARSALAMASAARPDGDRPGHPRPRR